MTATLIHGGRTISPAEFESRAARVGGGLAALGVGMNDVVAVMLRNEPAWLEIMLGSRPLGVYYVPMNWHFKADEAGYILRDCNAKVLFVGAELVAQIRDGIPAGIPVIVVPPSAATSKAFRLDALETPAVHGSSGILDWHLWEDWLAAQAPYTGNPQPPRGMMPYTSGTTGRPKGVRRIPFAPEEAAAAAQRAMFITASVLGIEPGMRCLLSAPLYHSAPNGYSLLVMQQSEALMVLEPRFDAERTLSLIAEYRLTHAYLVPTMMVRLLGLAAEVRARYDTSSLRYIGSTGSPCAPEVKRAMIDWLGPIVNEGYASSESGYITKISSVESQRKPGSAGRAIGDAVIEIHDDDGNVLPSGAVGTIWCRQPAYGRVEYLNNADATVKLKSGELLCVGDMGYVDDEGYLFITDRKSDMVISGGVNIYPAEIEAVLIAMPGVADCAVFGIPDAEMGESLLACVQRTANATLTPEEVRTWLGARIASYKVPRKVELRDELPREDSGKIFKRKLRDAYWVGQTRKV